jgi:hypothetical protein
MQRCFWSIALIPHTNGELHSWFCRWRNDEAWFDFVTGERRDGESFRECIDREVRDSLGLQSNGFLVANAAQLNMEFAAVLPGQTELCHVAAAFYMVHLYGRASRQNVESHPDGRWLTSSELFAGETADGKRVNPALTYLLKRSEVIPAWTPPLGADETQVDL